MSRKAKTITLTSLLLLAVGAVLSACGGSGSLATPDGPHMIYFYAKW
jgi:hypothetical protein